MVYISRHHQAHFSDPARPTPVLVLVRSPLQRRAISALLGSHVRLHVVGAAGGLEDAVALVRRCDPELVIACLSDRRNLLLARQLLARVPHLMAVGVNASGDDHGVLAAVEAGIRALVDLDADLADLIRIIDEVRMLGTSFPPWATAVMQRRIQSMAHGEPAAQLNRLTRRELEIVRLIADGMANREIACNLCIEVSTVKNHLHSIFDKLGVHSRVEACLLVRSIDR